MGVPNGLMFCCLGISNDGLRRGRREERLLGRGGHSMDGLRRGRVRILLLMFVGFQE
jgi:hypothetical protein